MSTIDDVNKLVLLVTRALSGSTPSFEVLSDNDFLHHLEQKLDEELEEYKSSKSLVELADLIEVVYRIAELRICSISELEAMRIEKRLTRGGFQKNIFLLETN